MPKRRRAEMSEDTEEDESRIERKKILELLRKKKQELEEELEIRSMQHRISQLEQQLRQETPVTANNNAPTTPQTTSTNMNPNLTENPQTRAIERFFNSYSNLSVRGKVAVVGIGATTSLIICGGLLYCLFFTKAGAAILTCLSNTKFTLDISASGASVGAVISRNVTNV